MAELLEVQWALTRIPRGAIVNKSSKRHWTVNETRPGAMQRGEDAHGDRTLCGIRIPWARVHASNEGDCGVCLRVLRARAGRGDQVASELLAHVAGASLSGPSG